jgi:YbbR domain-containing protein
VRRLAGFVFHNWPLKVGAVGLAVILYAGMVILQSTAVWPGSVAITPTNYPADSTLVGTLPSVADIRYIAAPEVPVTVESFSATIDLANVTPSESDSLVNVKLVAADQRIQIVDYQPKQILVKLNPIITSSVPVVADWGTPPSGVSPGTPTITLGNGDGTVVSTVLVRGAATYVREVAYARATVRIDASGLDVNQDVALVACKSNGDTVNNVTLNPAQVHVAIPVGSQRRSETVPIVPVTVNSPAAGYYVSSVDISPTFVEVEGQADALAQLQNRVATKPISIAGATGDVTVTNAELDLPPGVTVSNAPEIKIVIHLTSPNSTRSFSIGVVPTGESAALQYSFSTLNVTVTIGGATAALNAFDTSSLTGSISVSGMGPGTSAATVSVKLPAGIKLVSITPAQISVTVTSPATPTPLASASSSTTP